MSNDDVYVLEDVFTHDPLEWISLSRYGEPAISEAYHDYKHYFRYLVETWRRLQEDYARLGSYAKKLDQSMDAGIENDDGAIQEYFRTVLLVQMDTESFIMFSNRFMDKAGKFIERIIKSNDDKTVGNTFGKHKDFFIAPNNHHYNPAYSQFLKDNTAWYGQLSAMRDKLIEHGARSFNNALLTSPKKGRIYVLKNHSFFRVTPEDGSTLSEIKKNYEGKYPELVKVVDNAWEILRCIMENNIELNSKDTKKVMEINTRMGGLLDAPGIARNIKHFLEEVARMVGS